MLASNYCNPFNVCLTELRQYFSNTLNSHHQLVNFKETICTPYTKTVGISVFKSFSLIQFEGKKKTKQ